MTGPYDYVAPSYWYVDQHNGGAYGFNTETSPRTCNPNAGEQKEISPGCSGHGRRRRTGRCIMEETNSQY